MSVAWQIKYPPSAGLTSLASSGKLGGTSNQEYGNWFSRTSGSPISTLARLQRHHNGHFGSISSLPGATLTGPGPAVNGTSGSSHAISNPHNIPTHISSSGRNSPSYVSITSVSQASNSPTASPSPSHPEGKRFYSFISKVNTDGKDTSGGDPSAVRFDHGPGAHLTLTRKPSDTPTNSPQIERKLVPYSTRHIGQSRPYTTSDDSVLVVPRSPRSPRSPRGLPIGGVSGTLQRSHTMSEFDTQRLQGSRPQELRRLKSFHDTPTWRQTMMPDDDPPKAPASVTSRSVLPSVPSSNSVQGVELGSRVASSAVNRHPSSWLARDQGALKQDLSPKPFTTDSYRAYTTPEDTPITKYSVAVSDLPSRMADVHSGLSFPSRHSEGGPRPLDSGSLRRDGSNNHSASTYVHSGSMPSLNGLTSSTFSSQPPSNLSMVDGKPPNGNNHLEMNGMPSKAVKSILKKKSSYGPKSPGYEAPPWNPSTTIRMGGVERSLPQLRGNMPYSATISYFSDSLAAEERKRTATNGNGKRVTFAAWCDVITLVTGFRPCLGKQDLFLAVWVRWY